MTEPAQEKSKRKYGIDLLIIGLSFLVIYGIAGIAYGLLKLDIGKPLLVQTFMGAFVQFGIMGFGIVVVCVLRRESFLSFGFKKEKLLLTVLLSALVCLPHLLLNIYQHGSISYFPFQGVNFTKSLIGSDFPVNIIGMFMVITAWGFFEGFYYVVVYDRINKLLPSKSLFLNWAAIICGILCLLFHIIVGHSYGIDAIATFILIYGMLVVYQYTGNAWGCVFIYCFFWNAI